MHSEPLAEHRWQIGWSLLHLTFDAAQASHDARSLGRRSRSAFLVDEGAEVGDCMASVEVGASNLVGDCCHWGSSVGKDIVAILVEVWMAEICLFEYDFLDFFV